MDIRSSQLVLRRSFKVVALVLTGLLAITAQAERAFFDKSPWSAQEKAEILERFEYDPSLVKVSGLLKKTETDTHASFQLWAHGEVQGEPVRMKFRYYNSKRKAQIRDGKKPVVIVLSTVGGVTVLEHHIARYLTSKGINAVVPYYYKREFSKDNAIPLDQIDDVFTQRVSAIRMIIDAISKWKHVDTTRIGSFGHSLGAITNSLLMGVDKRISAGIFVAGGGHWAKVFAETEAPRISAYREHIMLRNGLTTRDEFYNLFLERVQFDGIHFAHLRDAKDINFVIASKDETVVTSSQLELAEAFGVKKKNIQVGGKGHIPTILKVGTQNRQSMIYDFFIKRWSNFKK